MRRLLRYVEPWSVLKVSLLLYSCAWAVLMFVGVTLWRLAVNAGLVANVENFVTELGALESFEIHGDQIFRIAAVGGLLLVVAFTGLTVLGSVVFNLISDITGGVRFTVVEEETARPRVRRTRRRRVLVAGSPPAQAGASGAGVPPPARTGVPQTGVSRTGPAQVVVPRPDASQTGVAVPVVAPPDGPTRRAGRVRRRSRRGGVRRGRG